MRELPSQVAHRLMAAEKGTGASTPVEVLQVESPLQKVECMKLAGRRKVLCFGVGAGALMLLGCDVSEQDASAAAAPPPAASPPPASPAWVVNPPSFAVGSGATFNMATTLPAGVARGGAFGVSSAGARLPAGMTFTPPGILSVGTATVGSVAGVVFTYASP